VGEKTQNTNLASEYYILSCLYRIGSNAYLTLGNKKSVDIVVEKADALLTIDVKGLEGSSSFPVDNWSKKDKNHFFVFVSYTGKIEDTNRVPETYIVPTNELELTHKELDGESLIYVNPKGNRKVVPLSKLRKLEKYGNNWKPFIDLPQKTPK